jgi:hypothetical protein
MRVRYLMAGARAAILAGAIWDEACGDSIDSNVRYGMRCARTFYRRDRRRVGAEAAAESLRG